MNAMCASIDLALAVNEGEPSLRDFADKVGCAASWPERDA
jgi:hypothetical protein